MNRPLSKRAQDGMSGTNTVQNIQSLKGELGKLGPMIQNLPAQLEAVNKLVSDIEVQVQSLEQMRANVVKQQAEMKTQTQEAGQAAQADDGANQDARDFWKAVQNVAGKGMATLEKFFGKEWKDEGTENSVAGVRGSEDYDISKRAKDENKLKGGKGDKVPEAKVNKKQLDMGQKVEMEHTDDPEIAREIARDHLAEELEEGREKEDHKYYTNLKKIHEDKCSDGVPAFWRKNLDYGSH